MLHVWQQVAGIHTEVLSDRQVCHVMKNPLERTIECIDILRGSTHTVILNPMPSSSDERIRSVEQGQYWLTSAQTLPVPVPRSYFSAMVCGYLYTGRLVIKFKVDRMMQSLSLNQEKPWMMMLLLQCKSCASRLPRHSENGWLGSWAPGV